MDITQFELELLKLKPDNDDFAYVVDQLVELVPIELRESLISSIFKFFESHPLEECGMPGPLIHLIEDYYPKYKDILLTSLQKVPNSSSILMVNRILNSTLSEEERGEYIASLEAITNNEKVNQQLQDEASSYLNFQSEKNS